MKKTIYVILLGLMVLMGSCREQANLFDQSAAERLHQAEAKAKECLLGAPQGWEMRYFPNPESAGYVFLCSFAANGSCEIAAKNKPCTGGGYDSEVSLWEVDGTQGCVLTFNGYNTIFHTMSDPGDDGVGYEGDYEFVVLEAKADHLRLKGKKHGAYIDMYALEAGQDWQDYYRSIDAFNAAVFDGNNGVEMNYFNGDSIASMVIGDGTLSYTKDGEEVVLPYLIAKDGLHFYAGVPVAGNKTAYHFVVNADQTALVSTEYPAVCFSSKFTPSGFFVNRFESGTRWDFTEDGTDANTIAQIAAFKAAAAAEGAEVGRFAYEQYKHCKVYENKNTGEVDSVVYSYTYDLYINYRVDNKLFEGKIEYDYTSKDGEITFTYAGKDETLDKLLKRVNADTEAAAQSIASIFAGTFTATSYTGSSLNMVQLLFTDKNNANRFIHIISDKDTK